MRQQTVASPASRRGGPRQRQAQWTRTRQRHGPCPGSSRPAFSTARIRCVPWRSTPSPPWRIATRSRRLMPRRRLPRVSASHELANDGPRPDCTPLAEPTDNPAADGPWRDHPSLFHRRCHRSNRCWSRDAVGGGRFAAAAGSGRINDSTPMLVPGISRTHNACGANRRSDTGR